MIKNLFTTRFSMAFIALLGFICLPSFAQAASVNFYGDNDDMGLVYVGQHGTIINLVDESHGKVIVGSGEGWLPAHSEITFSYTFSNGVHGYLEDEVSYYQKVGKLKYYAYSSNDDDDYSYVYNTQTHKKTDVPSPVLATADIDPSGKHGQTTIINNSDVKVEFSSYFVAFFKEICGSGDFNKRDVIVTYQVSSVPLPGALPMFAMALAGILFLKGRKKPENDMGLLG